MPPKWPLRTTRTRSIIELRRKSDPKHGSYAAYERGCGCDPCRAGNTERQRQQRSGKYVPREEEIAVAPFPMRDGYARNSMKLFKRIPKAE